jgi:hypothetical protein
LRPHRKEPARSPIRRNPDQLSLFFGVSEGGHSRLIDILIDGLDVDTEFHASAHRDHGQFVNMGDTELDTPD